MASGLDTDKQRRLMIARINKLARAAARGGAPPLDARVLEVMARTPRHAFVPAAPAAEAYADTPLAIGFGQTISQPYIVALMSSLAHIEPANRVLEIGTGCGYQTAILAELAAHVYSVEVVEALALQAAEVLAALGTANVALAIRNGYHGWSDHAPYDAILVTAAPADVPEALVAQLAPGGRLIVPVGRDAQILTRIEKLVTGETIRQDIAAVRFVPLVH